MSREYPASQWANWAGRMLAGEHIEEELQNAGVLPHADTPLPPTNATIHTLTREVGYGTPERKFIAACGVSWFSRGSTGEHTYIHESETHWHKHVNCQACLAALRARAGKGE